MEQQQQRVNLFEVKVSGIPLTMTEEELEKVVIGVLAVKPQVVKLLKDKDGASKGIAFLKYKEEKDQQAVLDKKEIDVNESKLVLDVPQKHQRRSNDRRGGERRQQQSQQRDDRRERRGGDRERRGGDRERRGGDRERRGGDRERRGGDRERRQDRQDNNNEEQLSVFVGNLPFSVKHDQLKEHFDSCGKIVSVKIAMRDGQSRGFGYVLFKDLEGSKQALLKDGSELEKRALRVNYQNSQPPRRENNNRDGDNNDRKGRGRPRKQE